MTRLPGGARVSPADAVALIDDNFSENLMLSAEAAAAAHLELRDHGVAGGGAYDGLVALAARENHAVLVTGDARARSTYDALGAQVEVIMDSKL